MSSVLAAVLLLSSWFSCAPLSCSLCTCPSISINWQIRHYGPWFCKPATQAGMFAKMEHTPSAPGTLLTQYSSNRDVRRHNPKWSHARKLLYIYIYFPLHKEIVHLRNRDPAASCRQCEMTDKCLNNVFISVQLKKIIIIECGSSAKTFLCFWALTD